MKKLKQLLAFTLALAVLAIPAMAAETHNTLGVYDLNVESGYTLTPLKADGSAADRYSGQFDSGVSTVYEGVEKFSLSFTGSADQYVVFLLGNGGAVPTESNIEYIDQTGGETTINFTLFPYQLEVGEYNVYVSSTGGSYTKVASFSVTDNWEEAPYTLGDVDQDGRITAYDASLILQSISELTALTANQEEAADTDHNGTVTAFDASRIIQYVSEIISGF